ATYGLHALIDEARRRARRRRWLTAGVLAVLVAAGIWGGLTLTSGSRATPTPPAPPGYHLVRARGPVQHALVRGFFRSMLGPRVVGKPSMQRIQVWFDPETGLMRTRGCVSGRCFPDEVNSCVPWCRSSTSALLFYRYWPVDTTKFVRRPGIGTFHGRKVIWLGRIQESFPPSWGNGEW